MIIYSVEINFDSLVGPTHNYAGLALGNLASAASRMQESNPRQAALEGLEKMRMLMELGVPQAVIPPQHRPDLRVLRRAGFEGSDAKVLRAALNENPDLLAAASSSSSMWAANAATVSPGADTGDGRLHFTPANLAAQRHRSIEAEGVTRVLRTVFSDQSLFVHHDPLGTDPSLCDEGAANHMRLCADHRLPGVEVFVYGRDAEAGSSGTARFPARQSLNASGAIARQHKLDPGRTVFIRQSPEAIDAGVFHNDVIAVANRNVLLYHERAWNDTPDVVEQLRHRLSECGGELLPVMVSQRELSLADAVSCYLFNSQIVDVPDGSMLLVAPRECLDFPAALAVIDRLMLSTPVRAVRYVDVRQSMRNGGGPACLRLRVVVSEEEMNEMDPSVLLTESLYGRLRDWINRRYRTRLVFADLADPALLEESRAALAELSDILGVPSIVGNLA